jgi:TRAP transporter TAXI family solute receptor
VAGEGVFAQLGPDPALRTLFSFHVEPFTLVVRRDSGILSLADLVGRRVNIGNPGSGQRGTMEQVMAAMGWSDADFALVEQLPASQHSLALCHDRVQAIVYTVGHPNPSITQATGLCDANIVEVSGPEINTLIETRPYFLRTEIPGGIYAANPDPVPTFGVIATVVASESLDEETAYAVVARVFGNLDVIRRAHPAFGTLSPEAMSRDGLFAPLHPGAQRYFEENGLAWQTAGGAAVPSQ